MSQTLRDNLKRLLAPRHLAFVGGRSPYPYLKAFGCDLFLSTHAEDVRAALIGLGQGGAHRPASRQIVRPDRRLFRAECEVDPASPPSLADFFAELFVASSIEQHGDRILTGFAIAQCLEKRLDAFGVAIAIHLQEVVGDE